jgi:hypothetical protein
LVGPLGGQHQSPITFQWTAVNGISYQVTLRHLERNIVYTSNQIRGSEWTFDIPADEFGNWEWFVTVVGGQSSTSATFTFNPFPNSGGGGANNQLPTSTAGAATPVVTVAPVPPTNTAEPTVYP